MSILTNITVNGKRIEITEQDVIDIAKKLGWAIEETRTIILDLIKHGTNVADKLIQGYLNLLKKNRNY